MILIKLKDGWPDLVVSYDHSGPVPNGHQAFNSITDLDLWKAANNNLAPQPAPIEDPVPEQIPMWSFRRALRKRQMLGDIMLFLESLPEQQRLDAMEHLEYGNYIERYHPMIVGYAQQLGIQDSVVDNIFREGSKEK